MLADSPQQFNAVDIAALTAGVTPRRCRSAAPLAISMLRLIAAALCLRAFSLFCYAH